MYMSYISCICLVLDVYVSYAMDMSRTSCIRLVLHGLDWIGLDIFLSPHGESTIRDINQHK